MKKKVIVIGAGASGLMSAISAAQNNADVTILEHTDRLGKKILATGNGKCNITNYYQTAKCYRSDNEEFPWQIIQQFDYLKTLDFFEDLGLLLKEKNGYVYPNSEQAVSVVDALIMKVKELKINVVKEIVIKDIKKVKDKIQINTSQGEYAADRVIIATGSKAAENTGSDGSGYVLAKKLGHNIIEPLPALVQLRCEGSFFKQAAGVRCEGLIQVYQGKQLIAKDCGELQLTDYGVSGIPTFQVSRYISKALFQKEKIEVVIDFMPKMTKKEFQVFFVKRCEKFKNRNLEEFFSGVLNKKLVLAIIKKAHLSPDIIVSKLSDKHIDALIKEIKEFKLNVTGTNSFDKAQVCRGGIDTRELTENMESKIYKNIFFAGEIVDVDGICGGYNLQWAWSSGYVAGVNASK